jgi:transposase
MVRLRAEGTSFGRIAKRFSVNKSTAMRVIKGRTWKFIEREVPV